MCRMMPHFPQAWRHLFALWRNKKNIMWISHLRPNKKLSCFRFLDRLSKKCADFFFFFFFCTWRKKKLIRNQPRTIAVFIHLRYIICLYQFSNIVGLHRLFIYFQYGCTLTSQTEHISAVYFEACCHISAWNKIKAVLYSAPLSSIFKNGQMFSKRSQNILRFNYKKKIMIHQP